MNTARPDPHRHLLLVLLVAATWALVLLPRTIQTITAPKYRMSVGEEAPPLTGIAGLSQRFLLIAVLALCVWCIIRRLDAVPLRRVEAPVILIAPWLYTVVRNTYVGEHPSRSDYVYPLVVIAVWFLQPRLSDLGLVGWLTAGVAALSLAIGVVLPSQGIFRHLAGDFIAPEKQILPWGILVGIFTEGNNLGQFLVMGMPAMLLVRSRWRAPLIIMTTFAVVWTASRSSLGAIAADALLIAVLAVTGRRTRVLASAAVMAAAAGVVVVLPLVTTADGAYSNRGYIWKVSLDVWRTDPIVGTGSGYYSAIGKYANPLYSTAFHGHNEFVHTLVTGGAICLALVAVLSVAIAARAATLAGDNRPVAALFMIAFCLSSTFEVPFGFVDRQALLPVTLVPMAIILCARTGGLRAERGARHALVAEPAPPAPLATVGGGWR